MEIENAAGILPRFAGFLLDIIILTSVGWIIIFIVKGESDVSFTRHFTWPIIIALYFTIVTLVWGGCTIGKKALGLQVLRLDGGNVTFANLFLREVVGRHILSILTFGLSVGVSFFMVMFREDKRALHDFVGRTYVIK